jgi:hypothetical protein
VALVLPIHPQAWGRHRQVGRWRFIVVDAVADALVCASVMTACAVGVYGSYAYRDGQTLDFRWFEIPGQPGAPSAPLWLHILNILPVSFLFALVFWMLARAKAWYMNESVRKKLAEHPELTSAADPDEDDRDLQASFFGRMRRRLVNIGGPLVLVPVIYRLIGNGFPELRLPPLSEEILDAALCLGGVVLVGAGLCGRLGAFMGSVDDFRNWVLAYRMAPPVPASRTTRIMAAGQAVAQLGGLVLMISMAVMIFGIVPPANPILSAFFVGDVTCLIGGALTGALGGFCVGLRGLEPTPPSPLHERFETPQVQLVSETNLRRLWTITLPEGRFNLEYDARGLGFEQVLLDGEVVCRRESWVRAAPRFEFHVGNQRAELEVKLTMQPAIGSLCLTLDDDVVYAEGKARTALKADAGERGALAP